MIEESRNKLGTEEWIAIIATVIAGLVVYAFTSGMFMSDNGAALETNNEEQDMSEEANVEGLEVITNTPGSGKTAEAGDVVVVNYRGRLAENNEEFDNSYDRGQPFPVILGSNQVIQGWELGLLGAQAGESRTLLIPSDLGYGETGTRGGPIPPNADLIFDIEVVEVIPADSLNVN